MSAEGLLPHILPPLLSRYQEKRAEADMEHDDVMDGVFAALLEHGLNSDGGRAAVDVVQTHYFGPEGVYGYLPDTMEARNEARIILLANSIGALCLTIVGKGGLPKPR